MEKRRETHFLSNEEKDKWMEDYLDGETAVARNLVQDAETAIMQEQEHMRNVEKARLTTTNIRNNSSVHQKHPGVPDGSDGSEGTSYPLTENFTLPVAQATGRLA